MVSRQISRTKIPMRSILVPFDSLCNFTFINILFSYSKIRTWRGAWAKIAELYPNMPQNLTKIRFCVISPYWQTEEQKKKTVTFVTKLSRRKCHSSLKHHAVVNIHILIDSKAGLSHHSTTEKYDAHTAEQNTIATTDVSSA